MFRADLQIADLEVSYGFPMRHDIGALLVGSIAVVACLEYLLVDASHRGNKYGTLLLDDFVSWATIHRPVIKIQFKPDLLLVAL